MIHFYKLTVQQVRRETDECVSILLEVPPELNETFLFRHGQYLTIRAFVDQQEIRRSYSICSSPLDGELRIAVKKVEGGTFSRYANERLRPGDVLEAMSPIGRFFTLLDEAHKKLYVAFAAGSGITPIISIIKTTLLTEPNSRLVLIYGNRSRKTIIFKEELEALKNRFMDRFSVLHILSREEMETPLTTGRIDKEKCGMIFSKIISLDRVDEFFICGPEVMSAGVQEFLKEHGVAEKRIHFELFNSQGLTKSSQQHFEIPAAAEATSKVSIKLDGTILEFDLEFDGKNILDAALDNGADLPFSCKSGVCCTCRAKLLQGEVDMDVNYGLEPEEVEQGFILTCQSHPRTENVFIDFDVK